ncbi:MAG: Fic family protein [Patescibacteria group bacterium]
MNITERLNKRLQFSPQTTQLVYKLLSEIDTVKGQWKLSSTLSPQMITRLQVAVLVTSAGASTRIEGNKLTDVQVEKLLRGLNIKKLKTRDEQEVAGYLELLKNIFNAWSKINLSESTILHFHQELLKYSEKDARQRGAYKFGPNRVEAKNSKGEIVGIVFDPTPPHLVKKEMEGLLAWTIAAIKQKDTHPLLVLANFIFEFLAIHPFQDGNGRLSRILTNFLLLKTGYDYVPYVSHEQLIEAKKIEYYIALNKTQQTWKSQHENITPWATYFLEILKQQSQKALTLLTQEAVEEFLSEKQTMIWQFALQQTTFSRGQVIAATKLNARTVEHTIKKLVEMNKLERIGEGRATRYKVK